MPTPNHTTTEAQRAAVLARLTRAYADAALCETWLSQEATRRLDAAVHGIAAARVAEREKEVSDE